MASLSASEVIAMRSTRTYADVRVLTGTALLVAVGAILGLVESALVPPLPVPGVRLGLANLAVVLALAIFGRAAALRVAVLRVVIVALAMGSLAGPSFVLALGGAVAAWAVMAALVAFPGVSAIGRSVAGAAAHVVVQLLLAALLVGNPSALLLAPVSLALALPCGLAIGYCARLLLIRLPLARTAARV
jgi:heptaprenyl diphosphate synthase